MNQHQHDAISCSLERVTKQGLKVLVVSLHQPLLTLGGLLFQGERKCVCECCEFCRKLSLKQTDDASNSMHKHLSRGPC